MLASQLAVKQGRTETAGPYAARAGAAARRSRDRVMLAVAARAAATPLRRTGPTDEALHLLDEASTHLTNGSRPTTAELEAAGMAALTAAYTAAQAHRTALAHDFAAQAEQTAARLTRHPHTADRPRELTADQCALYRIGIHRHLGDVDTALSHARRLRPAPPAHRRTPRPRRHRHRPRPPRRRRRRRRLRPAAPHRTRRAAGGPPALGARADHPSSSS
ncbi:hypothetical protein AB0L35_10000 [Streptomyces sp. NPDC052309]|uniref:hypothetical protein n=1 Tax=Streptomyces sp. NPDC052309 TaxID=3155421 RepID=UPI003432D2D1